MKESVMRTKAKAFALHVLAVCDTIDTKKNRGALVNQIVRSSTSIGANIHEAAYGASRADFINKLQIALKECYETEYWLELLVRTGFLPAERYDALQTSCGTLRRMLISSISSAAWRGPDPPKATRQNSLGL